MDREKLENLLYNKRNDLVGMSVNGYYYNVGYVLDENLEYDNEIVINCYEIEKAHISEVLYVVETCFTMNDLICMDKLEFFEGKKIEV